MDQVEKAIQEMKQKGDHQRSKNDLEVSEPIDEVNSSDEKNKDEKTEDEPEEEGSFRPETISDGNLSRESPIEEEKEEIEPPKEIVDEKEDEEVVMEEETGSENPEEEKSITEEIESDIKSEI